MRSISVLLLILSIFFNACDDETIDTAGGGGRFQVAVTVTPPLKIGSNYFNGGDILNFVVSFIGSQTFKQNSPSYLITEEYSVTKGQTMSIYSFNLFNYSDYSCRNVKVDFILNGNIVRTENYNLGYSGSTTTLCADGTSLNTLNYIIP
jgi:hypothetical protein